MGDRTESYEVSLKVRSTCDAETLMYRCITDEKRCRALLMSAGSVQELAHGIRLAAETNDRCPNAHAFTSFIHKMGFCFYILCTADTKTNII